MRRLLGAAAGLLTGALSLTLLAPAGAAGAVDRPGRDRDLRVATYNASLNRAAEGQLATELAGDSAQARVIAEVVQRNAPDVLVLQEFDVDLSGRAAQLFNDRYLAVGQSGQQGIDYPYRVVVGSNTGVPSGFDLNDDGRLGTPDDALGFGGFPGQFGFVVFSRYPVLTDQVRTFQNFLWRDMPGARLPDDAATPAPGDFYEPAELDALPLSSKNHADVPISVDGRVVHVLASHPTPPVFDGPEDRNGRRNYDEIRLWADYVTPGRAGDYLYDDNGRRGGLRPFQRFVIAGDQNSDPLDGDSIPGAIQQLTENRRIVDPMPASDGAVQASALQGRANLTHRNDPRNDTADFADGAPGNLRADYLLPSRTLRVRDAGVFWPVREDPLYGRLVGDFPFPSSDHRLVWLELRL